MMLINHGSAVYLRDHLATGEKDDRGGLQREPRDDRGRHYPLDNIHRR
jgi:hypothetical protein